MEVAFDEIKQSEHLGKLRRRWKRYEHHRQAVTDVLCRQIGQKAGDLAVLGAGACLDLELVRLGAAYRSMTLIDINGEALDDLSVMQPDADLTKITKIGAVDFTGIYHQLLDPKAHTIEELRGTVRGDIAELTTDRFDVVCSDCVFSEIVHALHQALPEEDLTSLIVDIRRRHIQTMMQLLRPAGAMVFMADMVSSVSAPELSLARESELPGLLDRFTIDQNFFVGCNPFVIVSDCGQDQEVVGQIDRIELTNPWRWRVHDDQVNMVYALIMYKSPEG